MIHYGTHCYVFTDRWTDAQLPLLATAKGLGLDLFEIAVGDDVIFSTHKARMMAESLDLSLSASPGGLWPVQCDLSAEDPDDRSSGLRWHQKQVDTTADMGGIAYTGALYGHPGTVRRTLPSPDEVMWAAEGLHALAAYGEERGVAIVLEPMSHFRTHLINTPSQLAHLLSLVNHNNCYALLDTYHLVTEIRDYHAGILQVRDVLWGLHACENDRGVPGEGLVPWDTIFAALKEIHFDGFMLFETYNSGIGSPPGAFARSRGMFHNPCPDGRRFVEQGLRFLKNKASHYTI